MPLVTQKPLKASQKPQNSKVSQLSAVVISSDGRRLSKLLVPTCVSQNLLQLAVRSPKSDIPEILPARWAILSLARTRHSRSVCKTLTRVSGKSIHFLSQSQQGKEWFLFILFLLIPGKNGFFPFFSQNLTRVSRKVD